MNVLWLCSWYPNKIKPYDGDFIQRHAEAASLYNKIQIIHVVKDDLKKMRNPITCETRLNGDLTETIIYYKSLTTGIAIIDQILSELKARKLFKEAVRKYIATYPDLQLVHLHVVLKAGAIALWIKKKFGIPFVVSEHWTGYLPNALPNLNQLSTVKKRLMREVFAEATYATFVSRFLADAVKLHYEYGPSQIIPNVVNTTIFQYKPGISNKAKTRFLHVSSLKYQKNIEQVLSALKFLKTDTSNFTVEMFVPSPEKLYDLVLQHDLSEFIIIRAEGSQEKIAESMQHADALISYSRYETFGCIVIEANACGKPAILSALEVYKEYSVEYKTALFVQIDNPRALADTMLDFIANKDIFNSQEISTSTINRFSYKIIGAQFDLLYNQLSGKKNLN